ncbi:MAG: TIR domain-containing protein [Lachnospiraceae bacterium]|jgi:uncharacterized protein yddK|nr:MAG: TIR domain-containing protein [Lachnospiraceae bacterium]
MNQVILQMAKFVLKTTQKQYDNLTLELLKGRLGINEDEAEELIEYMIKESVVKRKYTMECPKCNQLNTLFEEDIGKDCECQFCTNSFDGTELKKGASIRYILDRDSFDELMEENYKKEYNLAKKDKGDCLKVIKIETSDNKEDKLVNSEKMEPRLFISHSSKDLDYIKAFVEFLEDIGMNSENMFCSSIDGYNIKWGENIYDYLSEEFNNRSKNLIVLFMLSKNYYDSPACLNEMGAAWVLKKEYRSILLPGFKFRDIEGAINPNDLPISLEDSKIRNKLNDIKEQFKEIFELEKINDNKWDNIRDRFIEKINKIKE